MPSPPRITDLVEEAIRFLKSNGFVVQRYNAYSTNSIYLKLDYGLCNSIRFSDHRGKKHLNYRYNLLTCQEKMQDERTLQGWKRSFYPPNWFDVMLQDIVRDKEEKLRRYGAQRYEQLMLKNLQENGASKGFWSKCELV